jgi:hypothetical protein
MPYIMLCKARYMEKYENGHAGNKKAATPERGRF